jgi:hypothetical protein
MRRRWLHLSMLVALLSALVVVPGPGASAAEPISGRLVDQQTGAPVVGATVVLRRLGSDGGLGARVDVATTSSEGRFSLDAGDDDAEEFYVVVQTGDYQGGVLGGDPAAIQPDVDFASTFGPGSRLGTIDALPAFITGRIVDARTGRGVRDVRVLARASEDDAVLVADRTGRKGGFELAPILCEGDCNLQVRGGAAYETGYRACNGRVVRTSGAACATPIGRIGKVFLDRSDARPRVRAAGQRLVRPARIGKARVGMTVAEAMATGQFKQDVPNPPCDPIALQPTKPYKNQYVVFVADGRIVEMNAGGSDMATPTGARIFSTYRRLQRDYGTALTAPREVGFGQWGVYLSKGSRGPDRKWLGFLFGEAFVEDGELGRNDVVTLMGVTKGKRPPLILDGC